MSEPEAPRPPRTIRREVIRTRRTRRQVTVELSPTRAPRLGLRLVPLALKALVRGRPVRVTLRTRPTTRTPTASGAGEEDLPA